MKCLFFIAHLLFLVVPFSVPGALGQQASGSIRRRVQAEVDDDGTNDAAGDAISSHWRTKNPSCSDIENDDVERLCVLYDGYDCNGPPQDVCLEIVDSIYKVFDNIPLSKWPEWTKSITGKVTPTDVCDGDSDKDICVPLFASGCAEDQLNAACTDLVTKSIRIQQPKTGGSGKSKSQTDSGEFASVVSDHPCNLEDKDGRKLCLMYQESNCAVFGRPPWVPSAIYSEDCQEVLGKVEKEYGAAVVPDWMWPFFCNLTPAKRKEQLTLQAIQVSGPSAPITAGTPQFNALEWLVDNDALYVCPQDPKSLQRYVAAVFYFSTIGSNWTQCSAPNDLSDAASIQAANEACDLQLTPPPQGTDIFPRVSGTDAWLTPVSECFWGGLECNANDLCLDRIQLDTNNLAGTLPVEVSELEDLRFFSTERGRLTGPIPDEYGSVEKLVVFDVDFNEISGTIPSTFFDLRGLWLFDVNNNTLTGTLSPRFGEMTALRFLQVGGNPLQGTIPTELGNLDLLIVAGFEYTDLNGTMPQEICDKRVPPTGDGFIRSLISDCGGPNPQLECSCCTDCRPRL